MTKFTQIHMDAQLEQILSRVLGIGVFLAALVVSLGGVLYLLHYGMDALNYNIFQSEPESLRNLSSTATDIFSVRQCSVIQVGLLILLMTPILRVAFSAYAFAKQRDVIYLIITSTVLVILMLSLFNSVV
jgi:uncharacterized membrane protein